MPNNEFGDFQTPLPLAQALIKTLPARNWSRVLEPTCGVGNFLSAAADVFPEAECIGVEIQPEYVKRARAFATVVEANIFDFDLSAEITWKTAGKPPTLIVGNPPWVTNSQLSSLGSKNRPERTNFKNAKGIEAITGSSNFDIAEYIWIKLLTEFSKQEVVIALICKTQVARNVLRHCATLKMPVLGSSIVLIDAKKWFNASVDACWFTLQLGSGRACYTADVYCDLESATPSSTIGVVGGQFVANVDAYERSKRFDGQSPMIWRQGIKHDATAAMELIEEAGPKTKTGQPVDIEDAHLFPLLKCTDVYRDRTDSATKWMIVTQRHPGEDTSKLAHSAPNLWSYLASHAAILDGRKSSIYKNRPRFCIFGVGDYTFAPYKIAISGFHKNPEFRMIGPINNRPVVFDDATYLLPFNDALECAATFALLTGPETSDLIASLAFWDSKRPVTKKLLQRIDLLAIAQETDRSELAERAIHALSRLKIAATDADILNSIDGLVSYWKLDTAAPQHRSRRLETTLF